MEICWYCYWGWPKEIYDIYIQAVEKLNGNKDPLHFGPSHIVWEDENWDHAQFCLDNFKYNERYSNHDLEIVRWSLQELLKVDSKFKSCPEGYDDEYPENFPPPSDWVMIRK